MGAIRTTHNMGFYICTTCNKIYFTFTYGTLPFAVQCDCYCYLLLHYISFVEKELPVFISFFNTKVTLLYRTYNYKLDVITDYRDFSFYMCELSLLTAAELLTLNKLLHRSLL